MSEMIPSHLLPIALILGFFLGWIISRAHMADILINFLKDHDDELGTDATDKTIKKILLTIRQQLRKVASSRRLL